MAELGIFTSLAAPFPGFEMQLCSPFQISQRDSLSPTRLPFHFKHTVPASSGTPKEEDQISKRITNPALIGWWLLVPKWSTVNDYRIYSEYRCNGLGLDPKASCMSGNALLLRQNYLSISVHSHFALQPLHLTPPHPTPPHTIVWRL